MATGEQKIILKENVGSSFPKVDTPKRKHSEYRFCLRVTETEWLEEEGFTDVTISESMLADLELNAEFKDDVVNGRKKIVGKL